MHSETLKDGPMAAGIKFKLLKLAYRVTTAHVYLNLIIQSFLQGTSSGITIPIHKAILVHTVLIWGSLLCVRGAEKWTPALANGARHGIGDCWLMFVEKTSKFHNVLL